MQTAQRNSLRLLQWMMAASLALPLTLFVFASTVSWISIHETADREIERTLDVAHEHALKVFETIDRSLSEIAEIVRGIPDAGITSREQALHLRLLQLVASLPQVKSAWIFDASGHALVNSLVVPVPDIDFSDRDYFKVHSAENIGTYVGEALRPRPPYRGATFFGVSRRRSNEDGSFAGVIQASVLPEYFENFYARIGREPGSFFALGLTDGAVLARFPLTDHDLRLDPHGAIGEKIAANPGTCPRCSGRACTASRTGLHRTAWPARRPWFPPGTTPRCCRQVRSLFLQSRFGPCDSEHRPPSRHPPVGVSRAFQNVGTRRACPTGATGRGCGRRGRGCRARSPRRRAARPSRP